MFMLQSLNYSYGIVNNDEVTFIKRLHQKKSTTKRNGHVKRGRGKFRHNT